MTVGTVNLTDFAVWSTSVKFVSCSNEARAPPECHTLFVDGSDRYDAIDLCYASSIDQIFALKFGPPCT